MKMPSSFKVIKQCNIGSVEDFHFPAPQMPRCAPQQAHEKTADGIRSKTRPDRETLHREAEHARLEAEKLLEEARQERDRILSRAEAEAENLRRAAYSMGKEQGRQEALLETRVEISGWKRELDGEVARLLQQTDALFGRMEESYEEDLIRLAAAVAGTYIDRTGQPEDLVEQIRRVLEELLGVRAITIRVNLSDYEALTGALQIFQEQCPDSRFYLIKDPKLADGEFVCETDQKTLVFSAARQLEELAEELVELQRKGQFHAEHE